MDDDSSSTIGKKPADVSRLTDAWDHFYAHCSRIINESPGVRRLSVADREDCIQDVMLELVRKFGNKDAHPGEARLTGWIRLTSRNKAVDIVRRRFRKPEVGFGDGSGEEIVDRDDFGTDPESERAEHVSLIWEALLSLDNKVPVTSYLIFYLQTIEGWKVSEIAELFQVTPEQVRIRCHRVKKKFGPILKSKGRGAGGSP